jgi:pyruvate kinase
MVNPATRQPKKDLRTDQEQNHEPCLKLRDGSGEENPYLEQIVGQLVNLCRSMEDIESSDGSVLCSVPPDHRISACNLLHYVALRQHDIRELQVQLAGLGLSSLGRCEASVMDSVQRVLEIVRSRSGVEVPALHMAAVPLSHRLGQELVMRNCERLLGDRSSTEGCTIMVTMPTEAADDDVLIQDLLRAGMTIARINCAHDDEEIWLRMIRKIRQAVATTGRPCRIAMDVAGPKLRTGPITPGPRVVRCKPRRDSLGRLLAPGRILFSPHLGPTAPIPGVDAVVPITGDGWKRLKTGDHLEGIDASGRHRQLRVERQSAEGVWVTTTQSCHFTPGLTLLADLRSGRKNDRDKVKRLTLTVGSIPALEGSLLLHKGDQLSVVTLPELGRPENIASERKLQSHAVISCTLAEVFASVNCGDRILFDDGRIGGVVVGVRPAELLVDITEAKHKGSKLRADKGINLPDSRLSIPALTTKDIADLEFIVQHADILNFSFVHSNADLQALQDELRRLNRADLSVILKIETRRAFDNLPSLLLAAMRSPAPLGVMIARGDLAIECGWERLAEIQEEILRLCEAAHLPCIWATQVLEELAHSGRPTRAEITDAAMGARAEGVMLNKGPNITATVRMLHNIVMRMQSHQRKNSSTFRRLELAAHHHPHASTD